MLPRPGTQKLPERWKGGTRAQQEGPKGAAEGRGVTKLVRPDLAGSAWRTSPNFT